MSGEGENPRQEHHQSHEHRSKFIASVMSCALLWGWTLVKALLVCVPVLVLLLAYCLPIIILDKEMSDETKSFVYSRFIYVILNLVYSGFITAYAVLMFGTRYCKRAIYLIIIPALILDTSLDIFVPSDKLGDAIPVSTIIISIALIYREKLPHNPTPEVLEQFQRKKEMSRPLWRMVALLGVIFFSLQVLFGVFLDADLGWKLILRFILLPLVSSGCLSLQMQFLKSMPERHLDYALPMLWMSNGILKIFERLFANSLFESGDYGSFTLSTGAASLIEIFNHMTYFHRASLLGRLRELFGRLIAPRSRTVRTLSMVPTNDSVGREINPDEKSALKSSWIKDVRRKMITGDIAIEIMMVFTVTFVLYFAHPLADTEKYETIPNLETCIVQLLIQIVFEFLSDTFALYWTIKKDQIPLEGSDIDIKYRWLWLWIFFMAWQPLQIFHSVINE